jgi:hypothetical protein
MKNYGTEEKKCIFQNLGKFPRFLGEFSLFFSEINQLFGDNFPFFGEIFFGTGFNIPEDPAHSTPDGSNFFIFSGRYVRDTMCNSVFFFNYFGSIFTQFRPGYKPQKSFFFNLKP